MKRSTTVAVVLGVLVVLVALVVGLGVPAARNQAAELSGAAKQGKAQVQAGAERLAALDATGAAGDFGDANRTFSRAKAMLGPEWLAGPAGAVPWLGRQYTTARDLVTIGVDGSTAGEEIALALKEAQTAGSAKGDRLGALLASGRPHLEAGLKALVDLETRASALDEKGLVEPLASAVRAIRPALAAAGPALRRSAPMLTLEQYLFSAKRRILVVSQDGAELRPTGGFAGSFGIVQVGPGGVQLEAYRDVYSLPDAPGKVPAPRGASFARYLGFRDANWWLDYPTSANTMLKLWSDAGQPRVDGIVVLDTVAMSYLLEALGPITVPSYAETFTADNLLERTLYYTQGPGAKRGDVDSGNKGVLVALSDELERRLLSADPKVLASAGMALGKAADAKHIQLYFTDPSAQAAVAALGWSGSMKPPPATTDLLAIANAMVRGGKVNTAIKKTIDYRVALKPDGSADTSLALGYSYTGRLALDQPTDFRDTVRVYRSPGTTFEGKRGDYRTTELGYPVDFRTFTLAHGDEHTEWLYSRVPNAVRAVESPPTGRWPFAGQAKKTGLGDAAAYRLFLVRQADLLDVPTVVTVSPPSGWRFAGVRARLTASGEALPTTKSGERVVLALPLSGDVMLDIALAR